MSLEVIDSSESPVRGHMILQRGQEAVLELRLQEADYNPERDGIPTLIQRSARIESSEPVVLEMINGVWTGRVRLLQGVAPGQSVELDLRGKSRRWRVRVPTISTLSFWMGGAAVILQLFGAAMIAIVAVRHHADWRNVLLPGGVTALGVFYSALQLLLAQLPRTGALLYTGRLVGWLDHQRAKVSFNAILAAVLLGTAAFLPYWLVRIRNNAPFAYCSSGRCAEVRDASHEHQPGSEWSLERSAAEDLCAGAENSSSSETPHDSCDWCASELPSPFTVLATASLDCMKPKVPDSFGEWMPPTPAASPSAISETTWQYCLSECGVPSSQCGRIWHTISRAGVRQRHLHEVASLKGGCPIEPLELKALQQKFPRCPYRSKAPSDSATAHEAAAPREAATAPPENCISADATSTLLSGLKIRRDNQSIAELVNDAESSPAQKQFSLCAVSSIHGAELETAGGTWQIEGSSGVRIRGSTAEKNGSLAPWSASTIIKVSPGRDRPLVTKLLKDTSEAAMFFPLSDPAASDKPLPLRISLKIPENDKDRIHLPPEATPGSKSWTRGKSTSDIEVNDVPVTSCLHARPSEMPGAHGNAEARTEPVLLLAYKPDPDSAPQWLAFATSQVDSTASKPFDLAQEAKRCLPRGCTGLKESILSLDGIGNVKGCRAAIQHGGVIHSACPSLQTVEDSTIRRTVSPHFAGCSTTL